MGGPEATHAAAEAGRWTSSGSAGVRRTTSAPLAGCTPRGRRDRKGAALADALPEGLRLQIVADYARMPVPRDLP